MPVKRTRTTHGLFTRESVTISVGEHDEPPTAEELSGFAEEMSEPSFDQTLRDLERDAREDLASLAPSQGWVTLLADGDRLYTREWFAAQILNRVARLRAEHDRGNTWEAISWGMELGRVVMNREIKLGLEADILTGRRHRAASRRGVAERRSRRAPARAKTGRKVQELINAGESQAQARGIIAQRENIAVDTARKRHNDYLRALRKNPNP